MVWGWFALCIGVGLTDAAHAASQGISGQVVDRNGAPVSRAIVSLSPGNVELVTDRDGRFVIDYLRDTSGERIKLNKKTEYTLEVFKPGYHEFTLSIAYGRKAVEVDMVTMIEETIDIRYLPENLDPALYSRASQSGGATYEGD